jgi:hypothetical protein
MNFIKELTAKDKDDLIQKVLDIYQSDPARLRKALPEVAEHLDYLSSSSQLHNLYTGPDNQFGLTDRERSFRREALEEILKKLNSSSLTTEEAVRGLEHGAALLIDDFSPGYPPRQEFLRLMRKATGIQPRKEGKPVEKVVGEGEASRMVPVVKGVELRLTWDLELVSVYLGPRQWRLRSQALSFVGIGADSATDVAERHDDYLVDAIQNG